MTLTVSYRQVVPVPNHTMKSRRGQYFSVAPRVCNLRTTRLSGHLQAGGCTWCDQTELKSGKITACLVLKDSHCCNL